MSPRHRNAGGRARFSVSWLPGLVLIPGAPFQAIILGVQVLAGVMLPSSIVFLHLSLNDREMLGSRLANRPWDNRVMSDTTLPPPFRVIHPLDDVPEPKLYSADLGRMPLSRRVKLRPVVVAGAYRANAAPARLARADAERDGVGRGRRGSSGHQVAQ